MIWTTNSAFCRVVDDHKNKHLRVIVIVAPLFQPHGHNYIRSQTPRTPDPANRDLPANWFFLAIPQLNTMNTMML